jgi:membrane protein implicated in regulation of membrane protease activity
VSCRPALAGILLQRGEGRLAAHAALLLLTNITTVTLSGAAVFLVTGFTPRARADRLRHHIGLGLATALLAVAIVAYPLAHASTDLIAREKEQSTLGDQVKLWLTGRRVQVQEIEVGETDRFRVAVDGARSRRDDRARGTRFFAAHFSASREMTTAGAGPKTAPIQFDGTNVHSPA